MKNALLFTLLCAALLVSSCARHIIVNFQESADSTGSIVITPTAPIQGSVLTIDDKLLVDKKFIKKITVKNVPIGAHDIHFSADSWSYKEKISEKATITVKPNQENAKIITRPPFSSGYYVVYAISTLVSLFIIFR